MKCKDFFIIRVDWHSTIDQSDILYHIKIQQWNDFYWKFFERVTGFEKHEYMTKYRTFTTESSREDLHDISIIVSEEGKGTEFLILKTNIKQYDIFMDEISKYDLLIPRIMKQTYIHNVILIHNNRDMTIFRKMAIDFNKKLQN